MDSSFPSRSLRWKTDRCGVSYWPNPTFPSPCLNPLPKPSSSVLESWAASRPSLDSQSQSPLLDHQPHLAYSISPHTTRPLCCAHTRFNNIINISRKYLSHFGPLDPVILLSALSTGSAIVVATSNGYRYIWLSLSAVPLLIAQSCRLDLARLFLRAICDLNPMSPVLLSQQATEVTPSSAGRHTRRTQPFPSPVLPPHLYSSDELDRPR